MIKGIKIEWVSIDLWCNMGRAIKSMSGSHKPIYKPIPKEELVITQFTILVGKRRFTDDTSPSMSASVQSWQVLLWTYSWIVLTTL